MVEKQKGQALMGGGSGLGVAGAQRMRSAPRDSSLGALGTLDSRAAGRVECAPMRNAPVLLVCTALVLLTGCHKRIHIPASELSHLDGYDVYNERSVMVAVPVNHPGPNGTLTTGTGQAERQVTDRPYRMVTPEGQVIDFTSNTHLYLISKQNEEQGGRFKNIQVDEQAFRGTLLTGQAIQLQRTDIERAEVDGIHAGKTLALLGTLVSLPLIVAIVAVSAL